VRETQVPSDLDVDPMLVNKALLSLSVDKAGEMYLRKVNMRET
jgi:hypothetical protein